MTAVLGENVRICGAISSVASASTNVSRSATSGSCSCASSSASLAVVGCPITRAPCYLFQNGQHPLAKNGLLHDDHHLEWLCDHALCAGTNTTIPVLPHLLPAYLCQECPRGERTCAMVCLGTPGMCSLVNTGVHICLVGEVFSQYVLVWGYCITKGGLFLRFLAVPQQDARRNTHFAELAHIIIW